MLAPFEDVDIERLIAWMSSPRALSVWAGSSFTFPLTRAQLESHLTAAAAREGHRAFKVLDLAGRNVIGHAELTITSREDGAGWISRIFLAPEVRGQGLCRNLMEALLALAFGELDLHRVDLSVFDFNEPAIACYRSVGFRSVGVRRAAFRGPGESWDAVVMGIHSADWRAGGSGE